MDTSRRAFLKSVGRVGLCGSILGLGPQRAGASENRQESDEWMGVLVDLTKCNGCRQCEAACQQAAGLPSPTKEELLDESVFETHRRPGPKQYTTVNRIHGEAGGEGTAPVYVKLNCLHCNDPACVSACLVGAMRKQANGAVTYDAYKCMGCRYCMVACPFGMPTYEYDDVWAPQVRKCSLCWEKTSHEDGAIPACVQACPKQCLIYGKRSELLVQAHTRIREHPETYVDHIYGEQEAGGTSWLYLSPVPFEQLGFANVGLEAPPRLSETIQHGVFNHFIPPVAWCGILGLAMWLTRPERAMPLDESRDDRDARPRRPGISRKTTVLAMEGQRT